jgi:hypothetical protein
MMGWFLLYAHRLAQALGWLFRPDGLRGLIAWRRFQHQVRQARRRAQRLHRKVSHIDRAQQEIVHAALAGGRR